MNELNKPATHVPGQRAKMIRDKKDTPRDSLEFVTPTDGAIKLMALLLKGHEELQEIAAQPDDVHEYADVLEVLYELGRMNDITPAEMEAARVTKRMGVGGLENGLIFQRVGFYKG